MTSGILALFIANFVGGAITGMFVKLGVGEIPPITFTALRFAIASLVILPIYLKHPGLKITRKNVKWVLLDSVFFTTNVALFSIGIQYTGVVISQIIYSSSPIIVAFLAYFFLKERITKHKAIGSFIALAGLLFLLSQSFTGHQNAFGKPLGNLIIMVAVFFWAAYVLLSRKITHSYSQISISFVNFLTSAVLLSFLIPFELRVRPFSISNISTLGIVSLLIVGIFSSAIFYFLIQVGIRRTSAFVSSLFSYVAPLAAAITAVPFLGEKITINLVIGGILIIFGVFYATTFTQFKRYITMRT